MNFKTADRLQDVGEYYFSTKMREIELMNANGKAVINLGIGSPDMAPDITVINTLHIESEKPNTHAYQSYKGNILLRIAIANFYQQHYQVLLNPNTEILPLIGSKEGIMHVCMTYFQRGDIVLIPNPGYPTYKSAVTLAGATATAYNLLEQNNWQPDINEIINHFKSGIVKGIFLNYPHMPTGQQPNKDVLTKIIVSAAEYGVLVIHDNPYSFILNDEPFSLLSIPNAKNVVIELNSLSKSHNLAGWRIGMLCASETIINNVLRFKSNMDSGMFLPLQLAAAKALALNDTWFNNLNAIYLKRKIQAIALLQMLNCVVNESQVGLFVWAKIPTKYHDAYQLSDEVLQKANVFITPGGIFGSNGNNYIRVSLCAKEEIFTEAIQRITDFFKPATNP